MVTLKMALKLFHTQKSDIACFHILERSLVIDSNIHLNNSGNIGHKHKAQGIEH